VLASSLETPLGDASSKAGRSSGISIVVVGARVRGDEGFSDFSSGGQAGTSAGDSTVIDSPLPARPASSSSTSSSENRKRRHSLGSHRASKLGI
jgi:hypothetical protein